ncbi:MAG TPA: metallopeptidase family protein [Ktedonobacteraceae bacterium]|nr:metallopeptidase family protein [Ktedonobacteraceae bacterium]
MPEMEPTEEEYQYEDDSQEVDDESMRAKNEQSARPFFSLLSFLMAVICLAIFLTKPLDSITGLLVLFGVLIFGIGGMLLLERKPAQEHHVSSYMHRGDSETGLTIVDSTIVDVDREDEEDSEDDEDDEELSQFKLLVEDALSSIPFEFQEKMANLVILVESEPDEEVLRRVGVKEGYTLLGLYQGVPLTAQGHARPMLPESITIYQRPIEDYCLGDPERIRKQVRSTVLHEVAHHFGMDHEEMPIWVK